MRAKEQSHSQATPETGWQGIEDIAAERKRQIEVEGWTPEHDDEHGGGQLATAAACYADPRSVWWPREGEGKAASQTALVWPWDFKWWKPAYSPADRRLGILLDLRQPLELSAKLGLRFRSWVGAAYASGVRLHLGSGRPGVGLADLGALGRRVYARVYAGGLVAELLALQLPRKLGVVANRAA